MKDGWPPGFVKCLVLLCLNNGAPVEECIPALQVRAWLAEWLSTVCLESTGQACVCWRVELKHASAFSSCVALVKSQALSVSSGPCVRRVIKVYHLMLSLVVSIERVHMVNIMMAQCLAHSESSNVSKYLLSC